MSDIEKAALDAEYREVGRLVWKSVGLGNSLRIRNHQVFWVTGGFVRDAYFVGLDELAMVLRVLLKDVNVQAD